MKIGADEKKKLIAMLALLALAVLAGLYNFTGLFSGSAAGTPTATGSGAVSGKTSAPAAQDPTGDPRVHLYILDASRKIKYEPGRDIFHMAAPPIPPVVGGGVRPVSTPTPGPPTPTPVPPIPLKYFGYANRPGEPRKVFISDASGTRNVVVAPGDIVERRYRLLTIQQNQVEMEDMLTSNRQFIKLTANQPPQR